MVRIHEVLDDDGMTLGYCMVAHGTMGEHKLAAGPVLPTSKDAADFALHLLEKQTGLSLSDEVLEVNARWLIEQYVEWCGAKG